MDLEQLMAVVCNNMDGETVVYICKGLDHAQQCAIEFVNEELTSDEWAQTMDDVAIIEEEYGKAIDIFPLIGLEEFLETPGWTTLDLARFGS